MIFPSVIHIDIEITDSLSAGNLKKIVFYNFCRRGVMKKGLFLALFIVFTSMLTARVVEFQDIVDNSDSISSFIVQDYELTQTVSIDPNNIFPLIQDGYTVAWVVNFLPEGWAVMSAITEDYNTLMFSEKGILPTEAFDENCNYYIDEYCDPAMLKYFSKEKKILLY